MELNILAFGIAKDIVGARKLRYRAAAHTRVGELLEQLQRQYPALQGLNSLKVAVNSEYVGHDYQLSESDEVVLIPPVSGG